jgi:hypothetical protein
MTLWAYDLDGVLAANAPKPPRPWGRMIGAERKAWKSTLLSWYACAPPLLNPFEPMFHVITARRSAPEIQAVTGRWIERHLPGRVMGLHLLQESRSIEAVVRFKGGVIKTLGVSDFVEDNLKVLKGLRIAGCAANLWYFDGATTTKLRGV